MTLIGCVLDEDDDEDGLVNIGNGWNIEEKTNNIPVSVNVTGWPE